MKQIVQKNCFILIAIWSGDIYFSFCIITSGDDAERKWFCQSLRCVLYWDINLAFPSLNNQISCISAVSFFPFLSAVNSLAQTATQSSSLSFPVLHRLPQGTMQHKIFQAFRWKHSIIQSNGKWFLAYEIVKRLKNLNRNDILLILENSVIPEERKRNNKHRVFVIRLTYLLTRTGIGSTFLREIANSIYSFGNTSIDLQVNAP